MIANNRKVWGWGKKENLLRAVAGEVVANNFAGRTAMAAAAWTRVPAATLNTRSLSGTKIEMK